MGSFTCYNCENLKKDEDNKVYCYDYEHFDWKKIHDQWMRCSEFCLSDKKW